MMIEVQGLTRTTGLETVFEDVDLEIEQGQIVGLINQDQYATTSFVDAIVGFVDVTKGRILFNGMDISRLWPLDRRSMGLTRSFLDDHFFDDLTVADHVVVAARNSGETKNDLYAQWQQDSAYLRKGLRTLGTLGLNVKMDARINKLTTVQRKLLGVGLATLDPYEFIIWEEPFKGIRGKGPSELIQYAFDTFKEMGKTVLFTTEQTKAAGFITDRLYLFKEGHMYAYQ